jgi:hypothetical protein
MPNTREDLKNYCLRRLGQNVIDINVDDDQVEDRIDDALEFFHDFHFDGTERMYFKHQMTADDMTNQYVTISEDIIGVSRIFSLTDNTKSTNNMFDLRYQYRLNDLWDLSHTTMSYYTMTMTHINMINDILNGVPAIRFNRHTDKLYIDWDWNTDIHEGEYIIAECFQKTNPENYTDVFNDRMVKKYSTALIKLQWGNNLSKFRGIQMPGGVTLDGQQIKEEAEREVKEIELEIRNTYEQPPQFYTG